MDDYLAKPVRPKTLEKMLVRWCLNKRNASTPQISSAGASVCSDESDNCTNPGIPCVGVDGDHEDVPAGHTMEWEHEEARSSLLTPRPTASEKPPSFPSPVADEEAHAQPPSPTKPEVQQLRRVETDELAQQSRDDKLIDAAGGSAATPLAHTPIIEKGHSLTEANVEKLQREEIRRRMS